MVSANGISRRHMLAISAAGGLALANGRVARAQAAKRIDQFAPELDKVISTAESILELATGFGGGGNTEGPVWWKEGGYLLFNSIGENRRIKYTPGQGTIVAKEPTNGANGLSRDPQGRLVSCEGLTRRVTREEADGSITVIANSFQGHRLNKPNDVVVKSDGSTYFTDPWNIPALPQQWDLTYNGVFRVSPDLGTISLLVDHLILPNGLAFSPDESVLYINDSRRRHILAFDVCPTASSPSRPNGCSSNSPAPNPADPTE
jgi:gluconolactonase